MASLSDSPLFTELDVLLCTHPCPGRHVSPMPPSLPIHQDCSCISHTQVQPLDIEEHYEDTSHQFLVSSPSVSTES